MAHAISLRSGAVPCRGAHAYAEKPGILAGIRQANADACVLANAFGELNALSDGKIAYIGLSRLNVRDVARDKVYGN